MLINIFLIDSCLGSTLWYHFVLFFCVFCLFLLCFFFSFFLSFFFLCAKCGENVEILLCVKRGENFEILLCAKRGEFLGLGTLGLELFLYEIQTSRLISFEQLFS